MNLNGVNFVLSITFLSMKKIGIQYNTIQYNTIFIPIRVPQGAITNIHS